VLRAARNAAAFEVSSAAYVRSQLRRSFWDAALVSTNPTAMGRVELDPAHSYFGLHVLRDKRLIDFHAKKPSSEHGPSKVAYNCMADEDVPSIAHETTPSPGADVHGAQEG